MMGNDNSTYATPEIVVADRFEVGEEIGRGTFCAVYKAWDRQNKLYVAIKVEKKNCEKPELHRESEIYALLQNLPGIPQMHGLEESGENFALIIDLLGPSVDALHKECGGRLSIKTVVQFGLQAVALLKAVHKRGIVYRDIKPQNFLTAGPRAAEQGNIFYIVDFGLANFYLNRETNEHIPFRTGTSRIGTARYMSINAHMGREQSRRDDLEALSYLLFYLLRGDLPWMGQRGVDRKEKNDKILAIKKDCNVNELGANFPPEFIEFVQYARSLTFDQKPNYRYITEMFTKVMTRLKIPRDNVYDWNEKDHQNRNQRRSGGAKRQSLNVNSADTFGANERTSEADTMITVQDSF